ncbi:MULTISPECIES: hypothetical protein [Limibacillus]|jgi:hypothetical protein|uniref:Uncharacterized protein n=1 Tax=Limibacillus halophilus TaxID=1579333 RepID=A0A839STM9_9PROT|nr:hypothetical protein [Limibacillus halophilus]MBB3064335.1 hypothetical protein [Limibacillus halophilus]
MERSPRFLTDPISEKLLESLVALAAEVNVLRDRVARLEAQADGTELPDGFESADSFVTSVFGGAATMAAK